MPTPIAMTEGPEWAHRKLEQEVCSEIIALQKLAIEIVYNKEELGRRPRVQRKEHLIEQTQTLNQYRANVRKKKNAYTKGSVKHNVPI